MASPNPIHVGAVVSSGFGDYLMWTPAFRAWKLVNPDRPIILHTKNWQIACQVYESNPDVSKVVPVTEESELPEGCVRIDRKNGSEGGTLWAMEAMGLSPSWPKAMVYAMSEEERLGAITRLRGAGFDGSKRLIGLQSRGGWKTKQWRYWHELKEEVEHELGEECQVVLLGSKLPGMEVMGNSVQTEFVGTLTFRETAAILPFLDAFVGFDSGLTFASVALRVPTVGLYGPHDPAGLAGACDPVNFIAIRNRHPDVCKFLHGKSCREGDFYGHECPLSVTADSAPTCMNLIWATDVAKALNRLPSWSGTPLEERR